MPVKVAVLGGSGVATPQLALALRQTPGRQQPVRLVLHGRSADKLEKVARVARRFAEGDDLLEVDATTDLSRALDGADYVLNQMRVGGLEARVFDETFCNDLGIPGEETVGPGGFANASRTIPVVLEYARQIERLCPAAQVISFVNPASVVQYALTRYTRLKVIGLCDAPVSLKLRIAAALNLPAEEVVIGYVGMHHFGWVNSVRYQGQEKLAEALGRCADIAPDIDPRLIQALGVIPGHYLNYIYHPDRMLAKKMGRRSRAEELLDLQEKILAEFADPSRGPGDFPAMQSRQARWYDAIIAPVLSALIETSRGADRGSHAFIVNVVNSQTVPWLPETAIVEVPCRIEGGQVAPLSAGPLPADVVNLIQANCAYEMLAVEAIVERDRQKALRALLRNPMIHTFDQANAVLERAWDAPAGGGA